MSADKPKGYGEKSPDWLNGYSFGQRDAQAELDKVRGCDDRCACTISSRHEWFLAFCEERDRVKELEARLSEVLALLGPDPCHYDKATTIAAAKAALGRC